MDTHVGQTITGEQFNKKYSVGSTISAKDFAGKYGGQQQQNLPNGLPNDMVTKGLGLLPDIGGIAGAIGGGILGTPADILTGPAGTIGGGVIGAGLGGATGKSVENIINFFRNQKQTPGGNLASELGQGALQAPFGLLGPEGDIGASAVTKLLGSGTLREFAGKTVGRAVGGYIAPAISQEIKNRTLGTTTSPMQTGAMGSILNMLIPGLSDVIGGGVRTTGKMMAKGAQSTLEQTGEKQAMVDTNRIQHMLGAEVLDTTPKGPVIDKQYQELFQRNGINPNEASIKVMGQQIANASQKTEDVLQTVLRKPEYFFTKQEVMPSFQQVVDNTVGTKGFNGQTKHDVITFLNKKVDQLNAENKPISNIAPPADIPAGSWKARGLYGGARKNLVKTPITKAGAGQQVTQEIDQTTPMGLNVLLKLKRAIGDKADWGNTSVGNDPYQQMYWKIDGLIKGKLSSEDKQLYGAMLDDHSKLVKMTQNYNKALGKKLPTEVLNPNLQKRGIGADIIHNPLAQGALAAGVANVLPLPEPLKVLLDAGIGLGTASRYPAVAGIINDMGQKMGNLQGSETLLKALQQLGVRMPGM